MQIYFLKDAKLDDSGAVKGLDAEIDTLAKADATAFFFNTADGNAQQPAQTRLRPESGRFAPTFGARPTII